MKKFRPILSDDPKDMEGAAEWAKAELARMEKQEKSEKELLEHIRPFIMEIAVKRGLVTKQI